MSANASSSSQWPTPAAKLGDAQRGFPSADIAADRLASGRRNLDDAVSVWPTPDAAISNDGEGPATFFARQKREKAKGKNGNGMGMPLAMAAKVWPTPGASEARQGFQRRPEGMASDQNQQSLSTIAVLWQTPATDAFRSRGGDRKHEMGLDQQARTFPEQWRTPRSHEVGDYQYSKGDKSNPTPTLTGQALSHLDPVIYPVGQVSSHPRRSLNPLFVEWLMGWPPGWTLLGWTDFACSATALSVWRQDMRSELLRLGLPQQAPPAQLGLF